MNVCIDVQTNRVYKFNELFSCRRKHECLKKMFQTTAVIIFRYLGREGRTIKHKNCILFSEHKNIRKKRFVCVVQKKKIEKKALFFFIKIWSFLHNFFTLYVCFALDFDRVWIWKEEKLHLRIHAKHCVFFVHSLLFLFTSAIKMKLAKIVRTICATVT